MDYFELGYNLFDEDPELILAEVWRRAAKLTESKDYQNEFVSGYVSARLKHDDYIREHKQSWS